MHVLPAKQMMPGLAPWHPVPSFEYLADRIDLAPWERRPPPVPLAYWLPGTAG